MQQARGELKPRGPALDNGNGADVAVKGRDCLTYTVYKRYLETIKKKRTPSYINRKQCLVVYMTTVKCNVTPDSKIFDIHKNIEKKTISGER